MNSSFFVAVATDRNGKTTYTDTHKRWYMKELNLNQSVYELVTANPKLTEILVELGFKDITKKSMLHSIGKMMTIPKAAKVKNIPMMEIVTKLMASGYTLTGERPVQKETERTEKLKTYLQRLGNGEPLENVRADFVEHFQDVDASEIMQAEQDLLAEGTPLKEVQKLCDVHSALFHGSTREEQIANAEKAVMQEMEQKKIHNLAESRKDLAQKLCETPGHPLYTLTLENKAILNLLKTIKIQPDAVQKAKEIAIHYAKKGDLLYPNLKVRYGVSGPSDVMWTVDDEIRDNIRALCKKEVHDAQWMEELFHVLERAEEMIYKETNILFPICADKFSESEWIQIYQDAKDYATCLGVEHVVWEKGESSVEMESKKNDSEIIMPGGHMRIDQLAAMLNTIPMEISFVDEENINRYFNEGTKVFKRPTMAIDREVFSCHPPKIEPMVRQILNDFRTGKRDAVPVWMEKEGKPFLVTYMAVRDKNNRYLGTIELVQDMKFAKDHFQN